MTQALYTSMGGMNSAQTQISVVANNVANINTTAFKAANVNFQNIFSRTITQGSTPTATNGGLNPKQVGLGVQVGSISRNFGTGTYVATGITSDMMISGNGYFAVMDANGQTYLTRDGNFTLDANGDLVNSSTYKVLGASSIYSTTSSEITVHVPTVLNTTSRANDIDFNTKYLSELNNSSITEGTFTMKATINNKEYVCNFEITDANTTVDGLIAQLEQGLDADINPADTALGKFSDYVTLTAENGQITFATKDQAVTSRLSFESGSSNFLKETEIGSAAVNTGGTYASKILDYVVEVKPIASLTDAVALEDYTVSTSGIIEATYSNGDMMTVEIDQHTGVFNWKYTTGDNVVITAANCYIEEDVAVPQNMVVQLATLVNEAGLVSTAGNMWSIGPNAGQIFYGVGGTMGLGNIQSGGLEGSNVDMAQEFSNMILAQRAVQANSRVFSTASSILETLVYIGQ